MMLSWVLARYSPLEKPASLSDCQPASLPAFLPSLRKKEQARAHLLGADLTSACVGMWEAGGEPGQQREHGYKEAPHFRLH